MGITHAQRIQQSIVSRRRTQFDTKDNESNKHRTTSDGTSNYQTSQEELARKKLGRNKKPSLG